MENDKEILKKKKKKMIIDKSTVKDLWITR